jgi:hypothetical protein
MTICCGNSLSRRGTGNTFGKRSCAIDQVFGKAKGENGKMCMFPWETRHHDGGSFRSLITCSPSCNWGYDRKWTVMAGIPHNGSFVHTGGSTTHRSQCVRSLGTHPQIYFQIYFVSGGGVGVTLLSHHPDLPSIALMSINRRPIALHLDRLACLTLTTHAPFSS